MPIEKIWMNILTAMNPIIFNLILYTLNETVNL